MSPPPSSLAKTSRSEATCVEWFRFAAGPEATESEMLRRFGKSAKYRKVGDGCSMFCMIEVLKLLPSTDTCVFAESELVPQVSADNTEEASSATW